MARDGWRYIAQHPLTGEFLEWDLPLADVALTRRLSGPWALSARIEPEVGRMLTSDGRPLLDEWGVQLWAEQGGTIRGGGILTASRFEGPKWELTCEGHARYPLGIPYTSRFRQANVDAFTVFRHVWSHVQSFPDGDLGVVVDSGASGFLLGTETETRDEKKPGGGTRKVEVPVPYDLAWFDNPDCGEELESLAKEAGFEYEETHAWAAGDVDEIDHRIRLGKPRRGRTRTDIAFVEGENVQTIPVAERDGETFAQYVLGLGAGEGSKRRRVSPVGRPDGRLRRVAVLDRPDVRNLARLRRLSAAEQAIRSKLDRIPDLAVFDHPNAPVGSWQMGDTISLELRTGWAAGTVVPCRIVEEVIAPATGAIGLRLTRADGG